MPLTPEEKDKLFQVLREIDELIRAINNIRKPLQYVIVGRTPEEAQLNLEQRNLDVLTKLREASKNLNTVAERGIRLFTS